MQAVRRLAILAVAMVVYATPAAASADSWWFKTPGEAAYCGVGEVGGFVCMTPNDGFWIRFTGSYDDVDVRKGYSDRFRGYRAPADRVLGFGQVFSSSDAAVITCWSRRTGLTCKHYEGLSFWLGRYRGYRIFYDAPGFLRTCVRCSRPAMGSVAGSTMTPSPRKTRFSGAGGLQTGSYS